MATQANGTNGAGQSLFAGNLWDGWMKRNLAMSQEISGFVLERLNEGMGAWARLAECKDPIQLLECQRQLAQKAIEDFAAEGQKISQMMTAA